MTNDLLLSTEGPMGYPIRPRGVITMHVAYTSVSRQAVPTRAKSREPPYSQALIPK